MREISLSQGKVALVDDELFDQLNAFCWYAHKNRKTFYAERMSPSDEGGRHTLKMHSYVFELLGINVPDGYTVDHADGNGLNNQRENLRFASISDQVRNRRKHANNLTGFIGVGWNKDKSKWQAHATFDGRQKHLGYFSDPFSAAWVRDAFVRVHYGDFAVLNNLTDRRAKPR